MRTELISEYTQYFDKNEYINSNIDFFPDIENLKSQGIILIRRYSSFKYNYHIGMSFVNLEVSSARKLIFRDKTYHVNQNATIVNIYLNCYKHYVYFELHIKHCNCPPHIVFLNTCMKIMDVSRFIIHPKLQSLKLYLSKLCKWQI